MQPRGIRNNNPGNIRWGDNWQGLIPNQQRTDPAFCQFSEPRFGIRAMAVVLLNYRSKTGMPGIGAPGIDTVREVISRWAPPKENDTEAYIASVAQALAVHPDNHIDLTDGGTLRCIVSGIIRHENGMQPYSAALIEEGVQMALATLK